MRLDRHLVDTGAFSSRQRAQREIRAGSITVNGKVITKPSTDITSEDAVKVETITNPYVSQGGLKLEHAIKTFSLTLEQRSVIDVGSSTGGFTDCALKHGARKVFAVDVGTLQLHGTLRDNDKVTLFEQTNFLDTMAENYDTRCDFITVDVSFTSSIPMIKHAYTIMGEPEMIVLVKPQFETLKRNRRGIVNRPDHHKAILKTYILTLKHLGIPVHGLSPSPIKGQHGNIEFLLHIAPSPRPIDIDAVVDSVWGRD